VTYYRAEQRDRISANPNGLKRSEKKGPYPF